MHSCTVCSNYPLSILFFIKVGYYFNYEPESTCMVCNASDLVISYCLFLKHEKSPNLTYQYKACVCSCSKIIKRSYSASANSSSNLAVFYDADIDKLNILEYIQGKSGIYM